VTDRYITDFSADKSADRSVWIRIGKLRIDRLYLTDMGKRLESAWISR
jgi:hypothetical protein